MDWILIGIVAGSLVTGTFSSKEACLGRAATLHEQRIEVKCVETPKTTSSLTFNNSACYYDAGGMLHC